MACASATLTGLRDNTRGRLADALASGRLLQVVMALANAAGERHGLM
jgi:hypothetical protein